MTIFSNTNISSLCEVLKGGQVELVKQISKELLSRAEADTGFFRKIKSQHMSCILVEYKRSGLNEELKAVADEAAEVLMKTGDRNFWDLLLVMKLFPGKAVRAWECLPKKAKQDPLLVGRVVLEFKHYEEAQGQSKARKQDEHLDKLATIAGWHLLEITHSPLDLYVLRFLRDEPREGTTLQKAHDERIKKKGLAWFPRLRANPITT